MLRIVIGLINYNGVACGINFEKSVGQNVPEDMGMDHPQVQRLLALFPGTKVENVDAKRSPTIGQDDAKVKADFAKAKAADDAARAAAAVEETPEAVAVEEEVGEVEEVEEVEEEVEEPVGETKNERINRLMDENSRDELVEIGEGIGATFSSRANKVEIAREIVEKQDA